MDTEKDLIALTSEKDFSVMVAMAQPTTNIYASDPPADRDCWSPNTFEATLAKVPQGEIDSTYAAKTVHLHPHPLCNTHYQGGAWHCDRCDKGANSTSVTRFQCPKCNYDLCENCIKLQPNSSVPGPVQSQPAKRAESGWEIQITTLRDMNFKESDEEIIALLQKQLATGISKEECLTNVIANFLANC